MSDRRLEDFSDLGHDWFWEMDETLAFSYFSHGASEFLGADASDLIGKTRRQVAGDDVDDEFWRDHMADLAARRPFKDFVYPRLCKDGARRWIKISGRPFFGEDGVFRGYRGVAADITAEKTAASTISDQTRELRLKEAMFSQVERLAGIGAWELDLRSWELRWSRQIYRIYEAPFGKEPTLDAAFSAYPEAARGPLVAAMEKAKANGKRYDLVLPFVTMKGNERWVRVIVEAEIVDGVAGRLFGTFQDVTSSREREEEIRKLALTDALTGLANRAAFQSTLEDCIAEASETGDKVVLVLADLDRFKEINDHFGHDMGDQVLREAAAHLTSLVRETDVVARLGGDEFAVIMHVDNETALLSGIADRLIRDYAFSARHKDRVVETAMSVGIAIYPDHADCPGELMRDADLALYHSKHAGRLCSTVFEPRMSDAFARKMSKIMAFKEALKSGQIVPYYQPVVDLGSGQVTGFEALMRWLHPEQGVLTPGAFAPVFEDRELMAAIGAHMSHAVMRDMRRWTELGLEFSRIGINVTEADLCDSQFAEKLERQLSEFGLRPEQFVIEITENTVFNDESGNILSEVRELAELGVFIALDDFGTGSGSLTHLKRLPVSILKIDKSFIRGISRNEENMAIVSAVVSLGKALGYSTVAEGVEDVSEEDTLRDIGCQRIQGFLHAKPMPADDVGIFLARHAARIMSRAVEAGETSTDATVDATSAQMAS